MTTRSKKIVSQRKKEKWLRTQREKARKRNNWEWK